MLFIGLGGSGIRILQHLKSLLTQELGAEGLSNQPVIFLGFDFDRGANDRRAATPLDSTEFHFFNPQSIADALSSRPGGRRLADQLLGYRLPFDIRGPQTEMAGAHQWRSVGHVGALLYNRSITEALDEAMIRLDQATPPFERLTAVIVASIAGGTGAGLFLEVAAILRRLDFRGAIDAVLLLPETFDALPFRERILQNAFAALIEVAAQQSAPIELPTDAHGELLRRPFRHIYLEGPWIGDRRVSAEPEPTYARVAEAIRAMSARSVRGSRLTAEANAPNTRPRCEESASVFSTIASSTLPPDLSSEAIRNHIYRCKTIVFREGRSNSPCATTIATLAVPRALRSNKSYIREITDTCRSILGAATTVVDDDSGIGDTMSLVVEYLFYPMEAIAGIDKYRASYRLSTEPASFHVHKDWPLLLQPFIHTYSWENQPKRASQSFKSERRPFISYAREDQEQARRLYRYLQRIGALPWLDVEELIGGQEWESTIRLAMRKCTHFLALISQNSVTKRGFFQKELRHALELLDEFPPGQIFIIPLRLDDTSPAHEQLLRLHWIDLFPDYDAGLRRLAVSLGISL